MFVPEMTPNLKKKHPSLNLGEAGRSNGTDAFSGLFLDKFTSIILKTRA